MAGRHLMTTRLPYQTLAVFLGGGVGAALRHLIGLWIPSSWAMPLPLAILLINLAGAAGLGAVFVLADEVTMLSAAVRLPIAVGFLGGFTTWSAFTAGLALLLREGDASMAALYMLLSLVGGPIATMGASAATRLVLAKGQHRRPTGGTLSQELASIEAEDGEETSGA